MLRILTTTLVGLAFAGPTLAQSPINSELPRSVDVADNPSPVGIIGWRWWKMDTHRQAHPANSTMPATASLVHLSYADTQNFVPRIEYRRSTNGGLDWEAPQVLHTFSQGELSAIATNAQPTISCDGDNVFFVFQSNRHDLTTPSTSLAVYCYGSNDRGATWQGPLLLTPGVVGATPAYDRINGQPSDPIFSADAAGGRLHMAFEARYTGSGLPSLDEMLYSSAEFDNNGKLVLRKSDVRITTSFPSKNAFDADAGSIAADANNVAIIWIDDRTGQGNAANKTFMRVSNDGGDTWGADVDVDGVSTGNASTDRPEVAISGNIIAATYQDGRNITTTNYDNLWMIYSNDAGKTWTRTDSNGNLLLVHRATDMDVDWAKIHVHGSTIAIAWMEEAPHGTGNTLNRTWAHIDLLGGIGISTGLTKPIDLEVGLTGYGDTQVVENVMVRGGVIAVAGELSTGEATRLSYSADSGRNWVSHRVSDGTRDCDDPYCSVTLNGDISFAYVEDHGANNTGNKTILTGLKVPYLHNDLAAVSGLKLEHATPSETALLLFSDQPALGAATGLVVDNMGFEINLVPGVVMNVGLDVLINAPTVYLATVDAQGVAAFSKVPNFSSLLGLKIYTAAATVNAQGKPTSFSDPVLLR